MPFHRQIQFAVDTGGRRNTDLDGDVNNRTTRTRCTVVLRLCFLVVHSQLRQQLWQVDADPARVPVVRHCNIHRRPCSRSDLVSASTSPTQQSSTLLLICVLLLGTTGVLNQFPGLPLGTGKMDARPPARWGQWDAFL